MNGKQNDWMPKPCFPWTLDSGISCRKDDALLDSTALGSKDAPHEQGSIMTAANAGYALQVWHLTHLHQR